MPQSSSTETIVQLLRASLDTLNQGWAGATISLVGILIGVLIAVYFYRRSLQGAQLAYQHQRNRLLGGKDRPLPPDVKILFKGHPIESLYRSVIVIWNDSHKTIYGENIVNTDALRVCVGSDAVILDARILARTREVNGCAIDLATTGSNEMPITFEFLDSNDGLVMELFHTEPQGSISLKGTIREMPRGFRSYKRLAPLSSISRVMSWFAFLLGVGAAAMVVAAITSSDLSVAARIAIVALFGLICLLYGSVGFIGVLASRRKFAASLFLPEFKVASPLSNLLRRP